MKLILEGNAEMVVYNRRRIKSIDCKLMSVLIEDALRAKTVEKLADDNFIFIRRAVDTKERARIQERQAARAAVDKGLQYAENPLTNADFEDKLDSLKRSKHAMQKLLHHSTSRILDIIGYQATESDSKRLEFAVSRFGKQSSVTGLSRMGSMKGSEYGGGDDGLQSVFGADNASFIERKIEQLGYGVP